MSKTIKELTARDLRRIHWKHYLTRKVVVLSVFGTAGFVAEHYLHIWWLGKGGELLFGSVFEHMAFEIPLLEKAAEDGAEKVMEAAQL